MEEQLIAGLMARGLSEAAAKGVVANMIRESGLNPGINEINPVVPGSRGGYGLNQWTGPRRKAYEAFASERGVPLDDWNAQLDFTMLELQGPEKRAYAALQAADDPIEATRVYSDLFLRPGIPHMEGRLAEAQRLAGMPVNALAAPPAPQQQAPAQNQLAQFAYNAPMLNPLAFARDTTRRPIIPL